MKRTFITIMAAAAIFAGCNRSEVENGKGKGTFMLKSVTADAELNDVQIKTHGLPSELNQDQLKAALELTITNSEDANLKQTYKYLDIVNKPVELSTGKYSVSAVTADGKDAAWDQPLFAGKADFSVVANAVSPVELSCSMTNAVVSVKCSDTFKTEVNEYNIKVSDAKGNYLTWTKDNIDNDGYFTANELTIAIEGKRSLDNSTATVTGTIKNIEAKDHIILNVDAKVTGQVQQIVVTIDGSVKDRDENIFVDGFEEIEIPDPSQPDPTPDPSEPTVDPDAPSLVWESNSEFARKQMTDKMDVTIQISAPNKIASFIVVVNAPAVNSEVSRMVDKKNVNEDGTVNLDLIRDETAIKQLSKLGLKTKDELEGQDEVTFELTKLIGMLYSLCKLSPDDYDDVDQIFTLKLEDKKGLNLSKDIIFFYKKENSSN